MERDFLLNATLVYARRGKYVFPCGIDKKPLVKDGFKSASRNLPQIRDWWRRWPQAIIGMPTGRSNGFMAIDCDGELGIANFLELCAQDGYTPETSWQTTPGGGRHYLFLMPEKEIKCSASKLAPHVDVRADNGYIICAPSIREDGKSYEWQANDILYPLPQPLLVRLLNLKNEKISRRKRDAPVPDAYSKKALTNEISKIRTSIEGNRNDTLNSAAYALGQFVGASMLDSDIVERELLVAAIACGLPENEAIRTIRSGLHAGILEPRKIPEKTTISSTAKSLAPKQIPEWPEPVYFASFNLPKLTREMLPNQLGDYCVALSEEKQTPLKLAVCMSLVALATAAQSRFKIHVRGDYCEPLNLYAICPLEPANRKTAIVSACSEPLIAWEKEQAEKLAPEIKRLKSEKQTLERAIDGKRAKAAKACDMGTIQQLQMEIDEFETHIPNIPRLLAVNTTPEALAALMEQMGGCIAIMSGEGGIFDILAGMYSQVIPNLDLFLKGHCGKRLEWTGGLLRQFFSIGHLLALA